ncbi:hypothetical protein H632_c4202p0, partial [Helicosporidium sp. ATCC 50920]
MGRDPTLSRYISAAVVPSMQTVTLNYVLSSLSEAVRASDKGPNKQQLARALALLFFFERLSPEVAALLTE